MKVIFLNMFICIFHILEFPGIISFPENYPETIRISRNSGKFPSKWKQHWIDHLTLACWELSGMNPSQITLEPWLRVMGSNVMIIITLSQNLMGGGAVRIVLQCTVRSMGSKLWRLIWSSDYNSCRNKQANRAQGNVNNHAKLCFILSHSSLWM